VSVLFNQLFICGKYEEFTVLQCEARGAVELTIEFRELIDQFKDCFEYTCDFNIDFTCRIFLSNKAIGFCE
jgi:hypothetical protein